MQLEPTVGEEAQAIAEAQAAEDRELLAALKAKRESLEEQEPMTVDMEVSATPRIPMNRADRRQQVKLYAMVLASTERQTPYVADTIIPRAERRHKKQQRRRK